ncbi:putative glycosyltransferase [Thioalkalivibrio nitratireducens DSM 14787]|uniref:Glycosyltransferase n=1 Tax=Thioalkalivibrio nitratireducens (strain DSM 14787 / UNIQEM 213 / ALEN2) TaxID=1255043 RepID=L0DWY8_THIND|nr:glycosyltransferase family 2 protein [Thioalkalivibrio nitratireducens]AGA33563.1 putative glycosyltransferase [Thioalkalivibrio nitratireducens DSM 14787]
MSAPRIGVVIVHWNSPELLDTCLSHLAAQTLQPARTVVVDNASRDFDAAARRRAFPGVTFVMLDENLGFAGGANRGARELGDCDWLAFLNPDAFPETGWLEALAAAALAHPGAASFASCMLKVTPADRFDGTGDVYHLSGRVWRRAEGCSVDPADAGDGEVFSACAGAGMYRRDAFESTGGFDEHFFCYLEDVDLGFRLRLAGFRCVYAPAARVRHIGSAVTGRHSDFSIYHGHRNLVWTFVRNMPAILFWPLLPGHLLLNLATIVLFTVRGRAAVIGRAKRDALRALPRVWRERGRIQRQRRTGSAAIWQALDKGRPWPRCRPGPTGKR